MTLNLNWVERVSHYNFRERSSALHRSIITLSLWIVIHNAIAQHCLIGDLPSLHYVAIIKSKACKKQQKYPMAWRDKHHTWRCARDLKALRREKKHIISGNNWTLRDLYLSLIKILCLATAKNHHRAIWKRTISWWLKWHIS